MIIVAITGMAVTGATTAGGNNIMNGEAIAGTHMDSLIPASKISNLTQGMFVGAIADNFDERIEQKIFHCEIVVDNEKVKRETARYVKLPQIIDFTDKDGNDRMQEEIQANYDRIRQEVRQQRYFFLI